MILKTKSDFREENLYPLWESFCKSKSWSEDLRLQGLNAGKLNLFEGPDYQGAEFELDGKVYYGDVEIHRYTNEWYHHHHHLDRRYNSVRLHLVWHQQPEISVYTSDERNIITLDIKKLPGSSGYHEQISACRISDFSFDALRENLKLLSLNRLNYKVIRVKDLVKCYSYDQVIFSLLMRILGSPNNATNFELLASFIPWEDMIKIKNQYHLSADHWIQFFLHMSGLKTSKSKLINKTEYIPFTRLITKASPLSNSNWQISGQRPRNHPIYHLKILAKWFTHFPNDSLYFTLKDVIIQRLSATQLLQKLLEVLTPDYSKQKESNISEINADRNYTWGQAKITEIIGNALIPFFYWEALMNSSFGFQEYLEEFYFTLPQLNKYAKLEKFANSPLKSNPAYRKFYIHQGLLYLHQHYCLKGECPICPLIGQHKNIDKNF